MFEEKKSPSLLPIMLQIKNRQVTVIGGGKVATRRIATLLELKLSVTVISPQVTEKIKHWYKANKLEWMKKKFTSDDITTAAVIIAATNYRQVNMEVFQSAQDNQLINLVDRPDLSDFHFPAICTKGKLLVSVSTSGASPGLTKKVKQDIDNLFPDDYETYVEFLASCRACIQSSNLSRASRNYILKELLHDRFVTSSEEKRKMAFNDLLKKESRRQI